MNSFQNFSLIVATAIKLFPFCVPFQLYFKCSGSSQPPPSTLESHVNPHTGVHLQEVTATVSKDLVYEFFGKGPFKCECIAWSPRGRAKSQPASIEVACKCLYFAIVYMFVTLCSYTIKLTPSSGLRIYLKSYINKMCVCFSTQSKSRC